MSCLFLSLAPIVNMHPMEVRLRIVEYLKTNPAIMDELKAEDIVKLSDTKETFQSYTEKMKSPDTWGGALEIRAFCQLFKVNVTVHVVYTGKEFTFYSNIASSKTMHIKYTGTHFVPYYISILE